MAQGYYTLQEAAKFLAMPLDELKQMAQKGQIRSFQDRGTLRFRIQDIQELARKRGGASDPDLVLGDAAAAPKSGATPPSGARKASPSPRTPPKQEAAGAPDVFEFDMDTDNIDLGEGLLAAAGDSGSKSKPESKGKRPSTPAGSDSDVRLVADGSDVSFSIPQDSNVKIAHDPLKPKPGAKQPAPSSGAKRASQLALGSGAQAKSKLGSASSASKAASPRPGSGPQPVDSGVRLVPMDDDSDVKLLGSSDDVPLGEGANPGVTDSNVRLEKVAMPPADSGEGSMMLTEEINLDEEIRKQAEKQKNEPSTKLKPKSELKLPTNSPFELSDSDLELPPELAGPKTPKVAKAKANDPDSSDFDLAAQPRQDGNSDFDLVPANDGSILVEDAHDSDFSLEANDDSEQVLDQDQATDLTSSSSGISLDNPVDAGISLEDGGEDASDFDLSLEVEDTPRPQLSSPADDSDSEFEISAQKTPKPKKSKAAEESSSEFDLSLDSDSDAPTLQQDDSEFELNLEHSDEGPISASLDSDSEFELTLDDSGTLAAAEEDEPAPQMKAKPKAKAKKPAASEEPDIFETDFDVPALDESDDATVADSELESSDFDLALDDSELANEEESGSQVVALDEDDAETIADSDGDAAVVDDIEVEAESSEFSDLDEDVQVDDEDEVDADEEAETVGAGQRVTVVKEKLIPPAPWGVMPVIFMLPCVVIMFLVGILGYEMVQTTSGLKPPGPLTLMMADMMGTPVKK